MKDMLKQFILSVFFIAACPAMAQDAHKVYLKTLQAYSLGYPSVEFYEAILVANIKESEVNGVLQHVKGLCSEFPKLDKYVIRIFNDDKAADPQSLKFMSNLNPNSVPSSVRNAYIAEINPKGELILFPFDPEKRRTLNIGRDWCKK